MDARYPAIEPYASGFLDVGDGDLVYWEACGNPDGWPALVVHGGPGSGCSAGVRRWFDPRRYRVILFDQRGCGRSTPHAGDHDTELRHNTTAYLLADMERLRRHLGVDTWVLYGSSWGSTLALAYAQRHPSRVTGIVLVGVTTTRRSEIDWLYHGVARHFRTEWERFRAALPAADRAENGAGAGLRLVGGYARLLNDPDPAVRARAADAWCAWEDAVISQESNGRPGAYGGRPARARLALTRICAHYFSHGAWLDEGVLLREANRLAGIPGVLIHGSQNLSAPIRTAEELAYAWTDAELIAVPDSGHTGSAALGRHLRHALDHVAALT
ncbi:putative proline iminopeptidase [Frankia canadensis]|uniref:Proline iminopeptidase n=1 Tax=Frankia canadensis TaxID=1836972 RepID=A0A2I2L1K1_9ACTN|nr:prolyl aminopeptidase [Frankia canadensis]SNQ51803.1 putative proline iminopeptidase [Frankia canadensis]SOU59093.1 putative proline iminopeptidase [Frankia canadensis]